MPRKNVIFTCMIELNEGKWADISQMTKTMSFRANKNVEFN